MAFFMGASAQRIMRFDERSWQSGLIPEERRRAFATLNDTALREVFERDTINRGLWLAITERLKRGRSYAPPGPTTPSVFDPLSGGLGSDPLPNTDAGVQTLVHALVGLQKGEGDIAANATLVRNTLAAQLVATGAKTPERNSIAYATVAARACLVAGLPQLAGDLLALGLKFDAASQELAYLARLLVRESRPSGKPVNR